MREEASSEVSVEVAISEVCVAEVCVVFAAEVTSSEVSDASAAYTVLFVPKDPDIMVNPAAAEIVNAAATAAAVLR